MVPGNMAEFAVKYGLNAGGIEVQELITQKDFLAQRLDIPEHLLQVLSWEEGCIVITYRIVRDVLPLAELVLYREDARAELTEHGVEDVYFASHPSEQPGLVRSTFQRDGPWLVQYDVFHGTPSSFNAGGPTTSNCAL